MLLGHIAAPEAQLAQVVVRAEEGGNHLWVHVFVVYHVTIVADGHWWLQISGSMVICCVLSTAGSIFLKLYRPAWFVRITQLLPHPGHE